jgi:hypothetical protein
VVYLALTASGARDALALAKQRNVALWVSCSAIDEPSFKTIAASGVNITRFSYPVNAGDPNAITDAVAIITEHHPSETVWVEQPNAP